MWRGVRRGLRRVWIPVTLRVWPLARLWYSAWGLTLDGRPDEPVWYFAYGANMHDNAFRARRGMRPDEWRVGRITGYRLRFNLDGRPKGRAAPANISPDTGGEVWGVLYRISRRELVRLNVSEGIPGRRYRPLWLAAEDSGGNPVNSVTYIANGNEADGKPSLRYIALIRDGARAHGLPEFWVSFLEHVDHAE
ncbi:MAG: gamma-glutamylcyclotransferase [Alphaproteobacteria bacterium]|nr:gamma-glutamylcyclotransferase [Alphaproteobacteria bacterium]